MRASLQGLSVRTIAGCTLLVLVAACGSSHATTSATSTAPGPTATPTPTSQFTYDPAAAHVPPCALAGKAIPLPPNFPQNFPVPTGTVIDATRVPIGGGIAVVGFIPAPTFNAGVTFFPVHIKDVGFKLLHLEVDAPHDSEGSYQGNGFVGGWALKSWCPGVMSLQISAKKSP